MARALNGKPTPRTVLWGTLAWHPAVRAWNTLAEAPVTPECIEVLHQGERSSTYRLVGAGPGGAPIIARRERTTRARIERALYQRILPRLPVAARRCCGFKEEGARFAWVFFTEDHSSPAASPAHA